MNFEGFNEDSKDVVSIDIGTLRAPDGSAVIDDPVTLTVVGRIFVLFGSKQCK